MNLFPTSLPPARTATTILLALLILWVLQSTVSYLSIPSGKHSYERASEWMYEHIPAGALLLEPHWDDSLPLNLPNRPAPRQYRQEELRIYEHDTNEKLRFMADQLSRADYVVFPTQRIPGSIPRIENEMPSSTHLLQLLFAGHLGYRLEYSARSRERLGLLNYDLDQADESLTVYDNPRASILRNVDRLSKDEIVSRILNAARYAPLPALSDLLDVQWQDAASLSTVRMTTMMVTWAVVLALLGFIFAPITAAAIPLGADCAAGLSRCVGLAALTAGTWLLGKSGLPLGPALTMSVLIAFALVSLIVRTVARRNVLSTGRGAEVLFWAGFAGFLFIRALNPEIFWGEKPMDFSLLNYFVRLRQLPALDPWASDQVMKYYYLGPYSMALLHQLSGVEPAVGYNLAIATIAGLLLSATYSLCLLLTSHRRIALYGALAIIVLANFDTVWLMFTGSMRSFDLFWASSRTFRSPAINEYPLWALLFADLHAHLIAQPIVVALLAAALAIPILIQRGESCSLWHGLFVGVLWGTLFGMNSWDFISGAYILFLIGLLSLQSAFGRGRLQNVIFTFSIAAATAACIAVPFHFSASAGNPIGYGWVGALEFNQIGPFVRHFGQWLVPIAASCLTLLALRGKALLGPVAAPVAAFASLPLLLGLWSMSWGTTELPWALLSVFTLFSALGLGVLALPELSPAGKIGGMLTFAAATLLAGVELMFLMDRMNTIFKFYNTIWYLLGAGAVGLAYECLKQLEFRPRRRKLMVIVIGACLLVQLAGALGNVQIITSFHRVAGPRPTLDGNAFLATSNASEYALIQFLNKNVRGTPTILEAHGPSYREFSRIVMHTGLPVVLGWDYHVQQRGTPVDEIHRRKAEVAAIYQSQDPKIAMRLLRRHGVQYVVVGALEREMYGSAGLAKFERSEFFTPIFQSGLTQLFRVND